MSCNDCKTSLWSLSEASRIALSVNSASSKRRTFSCNAETCFLAAGRLLCSFCSSRLLYLCGNWGQGKTRNSSFRTEQHLYTLYSPVSKVANCMPCMPFNVSRLWPNAPHLLTRLAVLLQRKNRVPIAVSLAFDGSCYTLASVFPKS